MGDRHHIHNGDCAEVMASMENNSVDAIVTDPPYGLAFMGAKWDSFGGSTGNQTVAERQAEGKRYASENKGAPRYGNSHGKKVTQGEMAAFQLAMTPIFAEALRVAKSGAHLLCFGGTRTFHRMTCAIEDAGWEIRDCIMWVYGSGFPKSMDVGKAIDKALGAKREKVPNPLAAKQTASISTNAYGDYNATTHITPIPATDEAAQWDGWGTCLKPAWEPIIVARKPLDGTVAHNVMEHGTGALNIDGCRVATEDKLGGGMRAGGAEGVWDRPFMHDESAQAAFVERKKQKIAKGETLGRFPANLVHDGSEEVLALFPESNMGSSKNPIQHKHDGKKNVYQAFSEGADTVTTKHGGDGSAARFFYCAKASKSDRGEGNDHPTVKPTALMRWLVRLVCPQGGTVLDPFCGSGSTGVACMREGMAFVGIERDPHYAEIADGRVSAAGSEPVQGTLFGD